MARGAGKTTHTKTLQVTSDDFDIHFLQYTAVPRTISMVYAKKMCGDWVKVCVPSLDWILTPLYRLALVFGTAIPISLCILWKV